MTEFKMKRGDRQPAIAMFLLEDQQGISLAGCTVRFIMRLPGAVSAKIAAAATIDDAATGAVSYAWGATDTDTTGIYRAEWEITFPNAQTRTVPAEGYDIVHIWDDLG